MENEALEVTFELGGEDLRELPQCASFADTGLDVIPPPFTSLKHVER